MAISGGMAWALGMTLFHLAKSTRAIEKTSFTALLIPLIFFSFCYIPGGRTFELSENFITIHYIYLDFFIWNSMDFALYITNLF